MCFFFLQVFNLASEFICIVVRNKQKNVTVGTLVIKVVAAQMRVTRKSSHKKYLTCIQLCGGGNYMRN